VIPAERFKAEMKMTDFLISCEALLLFFIEHFLLERKPE
jgi:hypothetical protein